MKTQLILIALTLGSYALANPWGWGGLGRRGCIGDNCARAVTGTNAYPAAATRSADCSSFFAATTSATPPWYASACSGSQRYSSACSCWGISSPTAKTTSISSTTVTSSLVTTSATTTTSATSSSGAQSTLDSPTETSSSDSTIVSSINTSSSSSQSGVSVTSLSSSSVGDPSGSSTTTSSISSSGSTTASTITSTVSSVGSTNESTITSSASGNTTSNTTTSTSSTTVCTGASTTTCSTPTASACLSDAQATSIVDTFNYLLANPAACDFNATAWCLFDNSNFTDTSDSINTLAGLPLGGPTFASIGAFVIGSTSQSPLVLNTLDTFHDCSRIAWRWVSVSGTGDDADEVKGIDAFYTNGFGQIYAIDAEFNSAAWLYDLNSPECKVTSAVLSVATSTSEASTAAATSTTAVTATAKARRMF